MLAPYTPESERETLLALVGTDSLPPMPMFLLSSIGFSIALIATCIHLCELLPSRFWTPLANAGQLAFSWYILHIILVIAAGVLTDFDGDVSMLVSYLVSASFFLVMCVTSVLYRLWFRHGPLEWGLRTLVR